MGLLLVLAVAGSAPLTSAHRVLRSPDGPTATFTLATNAACEPASQRASREAMLLPEGDEHRLQRLEPGQFLPAHDPGDRLPPAAGRWPRPPRRPAGGDATPGSVFHPPPTRRARSGPGLCPALAVRPASGSPCSTAARWAHGSGGSRSPMPLATRMTGQLNAWSASDPGACRCALHLRAATGHARLAARWLTACRSCCPCHRARPLQLAHAAARHARGPRLPYGRRAGCW